MPRVKARGIFFVGESYEISLDEELLYSRIKNFRMNLNIRSIVAFALIVIGLFNCKLSNAQCAPGQLFNSGFQNQLSCAVKSQTYNEVSLFRIPTTAGAFTIQYMTIDSITNLPAGITATLNKGFGAQYAAGETGCVTFSGATNAAAGQYRLGIFIKLKVTILPELSGDYFTLAGPNNIDSVEQFILWLRLKDNASSPCPCIDRSRTALNDIKPYNGTEPNCSNLSVSYTSTSPGCNGGNDASIDVTATNGVPPYSYKINNQQYQSSKIFSGLSAGSYVVWVKDSNNDSIALNVSINASVCSNSPCGNSGSTVCNAGTALSYSGFEFYDNLECFENGVTNDVVVRFKSYNDWTLTGVGLMTIYHLKIDSIQNLPCGLCWATNKSNNVFAGGEQGCIKISGTTFDQVGQYKLKFFIRVQLTPGNYNPQALVELPGGFTYNENDIPNARSYIRVKSVNSTCINVDTTGTNHPNLTTSVLCQVSNSLSASATVTDATCGNISNGMVTLNASGGTPPYSYKINNQPYQSSNVFSGLSAGNYTMMVKDSGNDSLSILVNITQATPAPVEICMVSVDSATGYNVVVWEKPVTTHIDSFVILKETNQANVYAPIGKKGYNEFSTFIDVNSNAAVQAYRYQLALIDTCGTLSDPSQFHKTIHLTSTLGLGGSVNLIWSHYEGVATVTYNIYRGTSPQNMQLLTTIASNLNSYTDLTPPPGAFYYFIEIVFSGCNPTARQYERVRSNIINTSETTSIIQIEGVSSLSIAPNPSNGKFVLNIETMEDIDGKVSVTDVTGRIMIEEAVKLPIGSNHLEYNIPMSGYYFVSFQSKNRLKVQPIIIAR